MRKLIRFSAVAFLVWAVTTFAWAAISHVTGVTGPAQASSASLNFVASAVTFADPPGPLGAPQRFAARQIRQAATAVERIHRGPERMAARLVDELGHRHRHGRRGHRHGRRGHRHVVVSELRLERDAAPFFLPLDQLDHVRAGAKTRAIIELKRHRGLDQRQRELIEQSLESVRERLDAVAAEQDGDLRGKLRDRLERLREILRDLDRELGETQLEAITELEGVHLGDDVRLEAPVRVRIHRR